MSLFADNPTISDFREETTGATILDASFAPSHLWFFSQAIVSWYPQNIGHFVPLASHSKLLPYGIEGDHPSSAEGNTVFGAFWVNEVGEHEYGVVISRLFELFQKEEDEVPEDDEYGASVPTDYALDRALSLLTQSYQIVGNFFSKAAVTTSFEGGIRVQWMYPHANIRLIVPPDKDGQEYIYFEAGDEYGTEDVSPQNLAKRIMWLQRSASHAEPG